MSPTRISRRVNALRAAVYQAPAKFSFLACHYQGPIEHFLPDHEQLQQARNFGQAVWDKATAQERAVLKEIAYRSVQ